MTVGLLPEESTAHEWYRGLTLRERLLGNGSRVSQVDPNRSERRLASWRAQSGFSDSSFFQQRLEADGFDLETFAQIVGETLRSLEHRIDGPPKWADQIEQAFSKHTQIGSEPFRTEPGESPELKFLVLVEPLLIEASITLVRRVQAQLGHPDACPPFSLERLLDQLQKTLPSQMLPVISPSMVLEINIARLRGELSGATPEERFENFIMRVQQPGEAVRILRTYPVMARQVVHALDDWVAAGSEFAVRLARDWDEVQQFFADGEALQGISVVSAGQGDRHRGGRTVTIVEFISGTKIVYKPRSLEVDCDFQDLLNWVSHRTSLSYRPLHILPKEDYGWEEFVEPAACANEEEIRRFYRRQGGYLALLYILEAVDFHAENLIAVGEHPVLVDLESLFHVPGEQLTQYLPSEQRAGDIAFHSVLRVGLLPRRLYATDDYDGWEMSGLFAPENQLTPVELPQWDLGGTDEMRRKRDRARIDDDLQNQPSLRGGKVDLFSHVDDLTDGFREVYECLRSHKNAFLASGGPLEAFRGDEVRFLVRNTLTYAFILSSSHHPEIQYDGLELDRHFDHLWGGVERLSIGERMGEIIARERTALMRGDIPYFSTRLGTNAISSGKGEDPIRDFLPRHGLQAARNRIDAMGEDDLARQEWLIRLSLETEKFLSRGEALDVVEAPHPVPEHVAGNALSLAIYCGDFLTDVCVRGEDDVTWVGMTSRSAGRVLFPSPVDMSLFDGLAGIAMFLAYLGAGAGRESFTNLAKSATITLRHQVGRGLDTWPIGAFDGLGGVAYALLHLSVLWQSEELLDEAERIAAVTSSRVENDVAFDVISGVAGYLVVLLRLYEARKNQALLDAAIHCGDHLLKYSIASDGGLGWKTAAAPHPLGGFSHGSSGIAWSLAELYAVTDEQRFLDTARGALGFERGLFSPEASNWRDLRALGEGHLYRRIGDDSFMYHWCNGSGGIGLSRLAMLPIMGDEEMVNEVEVALKATQEHGFGDNHSLCHGDTGNLQILFSAAQHEQFRHWSREHEIMMRHSLEHLSSHGFISGLPTGTSCPGLIPGIAGMGFGLLRSSRAVGLLPSVLTLEGPTERAGSDLSVVDSLSVPFSIRDGATAELSGS